MIDLAEILDNVPQDIYFFLNSMRIETKDKDPSQFCNIERPLKSQRLNNFQKEEKSAIVIQDLDNLH